MGFCMFGNAALAADRVIARHGKHRVAIVDFDVHHGNGTQHLLEDRSDVMFISIHEHPWYMYPGTGLENEKGTGAGTGFTLNFPVFPKAGDDVYKTTFVQQIIPALNRFSPQFLIISAGFDAALLDPLANIELSIDTFRWMAIQLKAVAEKHAEGRIVFILEGGYHLESLAAGALACIETLLA